MTSTVNITGDVETLWGLISQELQKLISPDAFNRWFDKVKPIVLETDKLILGVENTIYQYWIEENYLVQLRNAAAQVLNKQIKFEFQCVEAAQENKAPETPSKDKPAKTPKSFFLGEALNPRYTFETFVAGSNSEFAYAAGKAVAENPGRTYNPLFLHGSVGLGKTHLLHAIGHRIKQQKKNAKVVYITSEQFTNEFINAIQHGEIIEFRKRFRQADVLLIDDVQFFAGKEKSQEEFFHTFNALFDGNKQIILTSDAPPSETENLQKRLVSRCEWGLMAELQPPSIETRLAILRKKKDQLQIQVGDETLFYIAENVRSNVRRIEGALNRVAAWAALNNRPMSARQLEELLKDFIQAESQKQVTIDGIQRKVAETFDIRLTDMTSKRRPANIAVPRMVAMYLSRQLTGKSLEEIGDSFGGRDHGTVIHACKKIEDQMGMDNQLNQMVVAIKQRIERGN